MPPPFSHLAGCVLAACFLLVAAHPAKAQPTTDLITYLGGSGNQRLHAVHRLSDGTILAGGESQNLDWVPAGTPVTPLSASGLLSAADGKYAFLARFSGNLQQVLSVHHFPQGTAANIRHIRTSEVPGQPTGVLCISGARADRNDPLLQIPGFQSGYFIARLNGNIVDGAPTAVSWVYNVNATGLYQSTQPWDLRNDGGVIFARGASNSSSPAYLSAIDASGNLAVMTGWPKHILQDLTTYNGPYAAYNNPANPILYSELNLANNSQGAWRSKTWEDLDALVPDGNAGLRKGRYAQDLYGYGPNTGGGRGYTGYRASSSTNGIGQIAVDRRDNGIFVPINQQTNHADNQPDFEPCFIAMDGAGAFRWSSHLYRTFETGQGIHRSTDSAVNFTNSNSGLTQKNVRALHFDPAGSGTVYAGTYNGVYRSTDGGLTWNASNSGLSGNRVLAFAQSSANPTRVYAATNQGVFRSTDAGLTWTSVSTGLTDLYLTSLAVSPADADLLIAGTGGSGVFRSTDGGANWVACNTGLTGSDSNLWVNTLVIDPADPTLAYAGVGGGDGLFKSTDGGVTWNASNTSALAAGWRDYVFALAVHRPSIASPGVLYAGTNNGIYKSVDGGGNWTQAYPGGSLIAQQPRAIAINPADPNIVYAGTTYRGLFKTTDGGATWTRNNSGLPSYGQTVTSLAAMVYAVALDPANSSTLFVGTLGGPWASIPDQYGDSAAVNYSVPLESGGDVAVIGRSHGGDVKNLWRGDSIPPAQNPANPGFSYHNDFTGSNGNIHTSWAGRFRISDGVLRYATRIAEYPYANDLNVGAAYADANLDGWPSKNGGYPDLNTTQTQRTTPAFDSAGRFIVTAEGRLTHTTRNAWQKNPNRYRRGNLTQVTNATVLRADALFANDQLTAGAATFQITTAGTNLNVVRTIVAFNPATAEFTLDSPLPAIPSVGNAFLIDEGASNWSWFVRTHSANFTTLAYSSLLTGQFDRSVMTSAPGGSNTVFGQAIPLDDGVIVVGYHKATNGVADGNPIPTRFVPAWGRTTPIGEEGFIARLAYNPPPTVFVRTTIPETSENSGSSAVFTFTRTGNTTSPLGVEYVLSGTALNGVHFQTLNGTIIFNAGESNATLPVTPIDNAVGNPDRTVVATLRSDRTTFYPGALSSAMVWIRDNDTAGTVRFTAAAGTAAEGSGNALMQVERVDGNGGNITVDYASANGTASAGSDYTPIAGTLAWAAGDHSVRNVFLPVLGDGASEPTETVTVSLANPTGGAATGSPSGHTLSITDQFQPGTIQFRSASFSEVRGRGFANVLIDRTGGSSGPATVHFSTIDDTALAGIHYVASAASLHWADGETGTRVVTLPFLEPGAESDVDLFLSLTGVSGAAPGSPSAVPLTIENDARPGTVRFALRAYGVDRTAGNVTLEVVRLAGDDGAVGIDYATANGTALAGTHYTATTGTLSWDDGESGPRMLVVPILGAATGGNATQFSVVLGNPTGPATLGSPALASVTLTDDTTAATLTWNNTSGDWQWNSSSVNWSGNATVYANGMHPFFGATGRTGTGNVITLQPAGAAPAKVTINPGGSTSVAFQFVGGTVQGGSVAKTGSNEATFGTSSQPYAGSHPFPGGTVVTGNGTSGVLQFRASANITATDLEFGRGPITLRSGGTFRFIGNTGLLNDFVVESTGGNIGFNAASSGFPAIFKGTLDAGGDVNFAGTGGGNLGGYGHQYAGDILLTGNRLLQRTVNHGNTNFAITGNLHDGDTPGTLRVASRVDRIFYIAGADNTYTGGTVIESSNKTWVASNLGNPGFYDDYRAMVVEPASRLGSGSVTVRAGGWLVLRSNANLHPDASLAIETGAAVTVEAGISVPVGSLGLGGVQQPPGAYTAANAPTFIFGPGEITVIAPRVTLEATQPEAVPGVSNATFTVTRHGGILAPLLVNYTISGSAMGGSDYAALTGNVTLSAGNASATIDIVPIGSPVGGRNVTLTLAPSTRYREGEPSSDTVVIRDASSPGTLRMQQGGVIADETSGNVTLFVERLGGAAGAVQVDVTAVAGSAVAPGDFLPANATVAWDDGESGLKPFAILLVDDALPETVENFTVMLSNATGGGAIGNPPATVFTLIDNDGLELTWNQTGTTNRIWDETNSNWLGLTSVWRNGTHTRFTDTGAGNVTIQAGGVRPASLTIVNSSTDYTFTGGILAQGAVLKSGDNSALFGTTSAPYAGNHTFEGGLMIQGGGGVQFTSNRTASPVWFGTGNIVINHGTFTFIGSGDTADTAVNGLLVNPIFILEGGGTIRCKQILSQRAGGANTTLDLRGNLSFRGLGGGNGPSGTGDRLAGTIRLHGARTVTREGNHNNISAAILSTFVDGDSPGNLSISNRLDRRFDLAANSTHSGGTTFAPTVAFDPLVDPAVWTSKKYCVYVRDGARLGTGDVLVRNGGFAWFGGNGNVAPGARLTVETGGTVVVDSNRTLTVRVLALGGTVYTEGTFNATHAPSHLFSANQSGGGGNITVVYVPESPVGLEAYGITSGRVDLFWSHPALLASAIAIERRQGPGGSWTPLMTLPPNPLPVAFSDTGGLVANTPYTYRVRTENSNGASAWSNETTATTLSASAPDAPGMLTAAAIDTDRIQLLWNDNAPNETGYRIERRTGAGPWMQIAEIGADYEGYLDLGRTPGIGYTYRVHAFHAGGPSALSNVASATTPTELTRYQVWLKEFFGPAELGDAAFADPSANPDGDTLLNLAEYALGGNPDAAEPSSSFFSVHLGPDQHARISYRERIGDPTLFYAIATGVDLSAWDLSETSLEETAITPHADGVTEWIELRYDQPVDVDPRRFFRLNVMTVE